MQAKRPDVCELKNLGLDGFLYANVGTELNGSPLTVLSVLARLDKDPWEQAAGWAALSMAAAIDGLSHGIAQMPLPPATLAEARDIAARLVQLLPARAQPTVAAREGEAKSAAATLVWSPAEMMLCCIVMWTVLIVLMMFKPAIEGAPSTGGAMASPATAAAPPPNHAAAGAPAVPALR